MLKGIQSFAVGAALFAASMAVANAALGMATKVGGNPVFSVIVAVLLTILNFPHSVLRHLSNSARLQHDWILATEGCCSNLGLGYPCPLDGVLFRHRGTVPVFDAERPPCTHSGCRPVRPPGGTLDALSGSGAAAIPPGKVTPCRCAARWRGCAAGRWTGPAGTCVRRRCAPVAKLSCSDQGLTKLSCRVVGFAGSGAAAFGYRAAVARR